MTRLHDLVRPHRPGILRHPCAGKVGQTGTAITGASAGDPFEFSLVHRGQPRKLNAVADVDVSPGDALVVEAALSPSRMKVTKV